MERLSDYADEAKRLAALARAEIAAERAQPDAGPWVPYSERVGARVGRVADEWAGRLAELRAEAVAHVGKQRAAVDAKLVAEQHDRGPRDWAEVRAREPELAEEVNRLGPADIPRAYAAAWGGGDRAAAFVLARDGRRRLTAIAEDPNNLSRASIREAQDALRELDKATGDFAVRMARMEETWAEGLAAIDAQIPSYEALLRSAE